MARRFRHPLVAALALLAAVLLPASSGAATMKPGARHSWVARIIAPTLVHATPAGRRVAVMGTTTTWDHGPVQLMVLRAHQQAGNLWLLVRRPQRPNDSRGWINANRAEIHRIRWRISVSRAHRRLRVFRGGHLIRAFRTVVGKPSTPTPAGLFAIYERAREVPSDGFEGPWSLHLTAHSKRLHSFDGGSGLIAIHGRDGASLSDPLGTARSHGCIRISNHPVRWLASHVPLGTPVRVR